MNIDYQCHGFPTMKQKIWTGNIKILKQMPPYEMEVNARGSYFHIIIGSHKYGNYLCIPNWNIGIELSCLTDNFWIFERLTNTYPKLSTVDAISISDALSNVAKYLI